MGPARAVPELWRVYGRARGGGRVTLPPLELRGPHLYRDPVTEAAVVDVAGALAERGLPPSPGMRFALVAVMKAAARAIRPGAVVRELTAEDAARLPLAARRVHEERGEPHPDAPAHEEPHEEPQPEGHGVAP